MRSNDLLVCLPMIGVEKTAGTCICLDDLSLLISFISRLRELVGRCRGFLGKLISNVVVGVAAAEWAVVYRRIR